MPDRTHRDGGSQKGRAKRTEVKRLSDEAKQEKMVRLARFCAFVVVRHRVPYT
jgi:hypothetical protein